MKSIAITSNANHVGVGMLRGWSIRATAAAVVRLRKELVTGDIVASLNIATSESVSLARPILAPGGVYVEVVSGTIEGSLWYD